VAGRTKVETCQPANHGDRQDEETLGRLAMAIGDENSEPHRRLDH